LGKSSCEFNLKDNACRRSGIDRRQYSYSTHIPERRREDRRIGEERRSGKERRGGKDRRKDPKEEKSLKKVLNLLISLFPV